MLRSFSLCPQLAEGLLRQRVKSAVIRPAVQGRWESIQPAFLGKQASGNASNAHPQPEKPWTLCNGTVNSHPCPQPCRAVVGSDTSISQMKKQAGNINPHRANFLAGAAQCARMRQLVPMFQAHQCGRHNRSQRTGIYAAIGVASDRLINWTDVHAGSAANAI